MTLVSTVNAQTHTGEVHDEKHDALVGAYVSVIGSRMPSVPQTEMVNSLSHRLLAKTLF